MPSMPLSLSLCPCCFIQLPRMSYSHLFIWLTYTTSLPSILYLNIISHRWFSWTHIENSTSLSSAISFCISCFIFKPILLSYKLNILPTYLYIVCLSPTKKHFVHFSIRMSRTVPDTKWDLSRYLTNKWIISIYWFCK